MSPAAAEIDDLTLGLDPCLGEAGPFPEGGPEAGACGGGLADLSGLDEQERLRALGALTGRFSAGFLRSMRSRAGETLPYSNVRVLEMLEAQGPTIMREIANSLGMTARNMTAIIDSLEETGLVRRTAHPQDRRATVVELTDDGNAAAIRARCDSVGWVADAFKSLTLEEQQQYAELLSRLAGFFCPNTKPSGGPGSLI